MSAPIALLGASGYTGRLVARALERRGRAFLAAGRDAAWVERALEGNGTVAGVREVDVHDTTAVRALLAEVELVITTVGPFDVLGRGVATLAAETGTHYVDSTGEQGFVAWMLDRTHEVARRNGATMVTAAGFDFLPGDLLAALAAEGHGDLREVHVAYALPGVRAATASSGTRRTLAGMLGDPVLVWRDGRLVEEGLAEARRLAWFPRPVGPRHAAGFPGAEPLTVPQHVPGVELVRSYQSLSGGASEALQLLGNAARWEPLRHLLTRVIDRGARGDGPSPERRARTRWACVAEAASATAVSRAWAYGHDPYGLTAEAMVVVAERILAGGTPAGVIAPARVAPAADLLDDLAARTDLRWSRAHTERSGR